MSHVRRCCICTHAWNNWQFLSNTCLFRSYHICHKRRKNVWVFLYVEWGTALFYLLYYHRLWRLIDENIVLHSLPLSFYISPTQILFRNHKRLIRIIMSVRSGTRIKMVTFHIHIWRNNIRNLFSRVFSFNERMIYIIYKGDKFVIYVNYERDKGWNMSDVTMIISSLITEIK